MARQFSYPLVVEVKPPWQGPAAAAPRPLFGPRRSQRELVQASLVRCPRLAGGRSNRPT